MIAQQQGSILKGFIIYIAVSMGILFAIVTISRKITTPLESTTNSFFSALKDKNVVRAYSMLSVRLQSQTSRKEFNEYIKHYNFTSYANSSWHTVQEKDEWGKVIGTIQLDSGLLVPMEIQFHYEKVDPSEAFDNIIEIGNLPFVDKIKGWKLDKIIFLNAEQE